MRVYQLETTCCRQKVGISSNFFRPFSRKCGFEISSNAVSLIRAAATRWAAAPPKFFKLLKMPVLKIAIHMTCYHKNKFVCIFTQSSKSYNDTCIICWLYTQKYGIYIYKHTFCQVFTRFRYRPRTFYYMAPSL